jgi:hypothetical protein
LERKKLLTLIFSFFFLTIIQILNRAVYGFNNAIKQSLFLLLEFTRFPRWCMKSQWMSAILPQPRSYRHLHNETFWNKKTKQNKAKTKSNLLFSTALA